jgi:hypothetical protein
MRGRRMKNFDILCERLGNALVGNYTGYICALILQAYSGNEIGYDDLKNILDVVLHDAAKIDKAINIYNEVCDL